MKQTINSMPQNDFWKLYRRISEVSDELYRKMPWTEETRRA